MHRVTQRCTAQRWDGDFCDAESMDGAPFPICARHAIRVYTVLHATLREAQGRHVRKNKGNGIVYYIQMSSGNVKIGYTTNLHKRLQALSVLPEHVLATEPGGRALEKERHEQFTHLRVHESRELFMHTPEVQEHINHLNALNGAALFD